MDLTNDFIILAIIALVILGIVCISLVILTYLLVCPKINRQNIDNQENSVDENRNIFQENRELDTSLALWGLGLMMMFFAIQDVFKNKLGLLVPGIFFIALGYISVRKFIKAHMKISLVIIAVVIIAFLVISYF